MGIDYLDEQVALFPEQAAYYTDLAQSYNKKLWHQISSKVNEMMISPFFQQDQHLLNLYEKFVKDFTSKLNQLDVGHFGIAAAKQVVDPEARIQFLQSAHDLVKEDDQASLLLFLEIIRIKIQGGNLEATKHELDEATTRVDNFAGILDSTLHSQYYLTSLEYHKAAENPAELFKNSLLYLTYTPLSLVPEQDKLSLAVDVGLAALVGSDVYNFGELLEHPIIKVFGGDGTEMQDSKISEYEWLHQLLLAFNAGDIKKYEHLYSEAASAQPILAKNKALLDRKIRILALMDMVFHREANRRTLTFEEISEQSEIALDKVELLLMKAFSLGVLKGKIDEVDQTTLIKWVQPRVLNQKQIGSIRDRLENWTLEVENQAKYLESNAPEILAAAPK